eukprot:2886321-Rhodomonas_salina.2
MAEDARCSDASTGDGRSKHVRAHEGDSKESPAHIARSDRPSVHARTHAHGPPQYAPPHTKHVPFQSCSVRPIVYTHARGPTAVPDPAQQKGSHLTRRETHASALTNEKNPIEVQGWWLMVQVFRILLGQRVSGFGFR